MHNKSLWVLQWLVGSYFIVFGIMHFVVPEGLPDPLSWMYELSDTLHIVSGTAEILGGLGLILPAVTRILPMLTALAALGLLIVMAGAVIWHVDRGELQNVVINTFNVAVLAYIAYGRWRLAPIGARSG